MRIDIQLIPLLPDSSLLVNRTVVVIDVLRATSVIVHALSKGALEIIPVETTDMAFRQRDHFPPGSTLLGGERHSKRIEGFDLGNSPREYVPEIVKNKRIILMTTNGTKAFHSVSKGKEVMAASFLNIRAAAERCVERDHDVMVFPSGNNGKFSLEDAVCGGMLIDRIRKSIRVGTNRNDCCTYTVVPTPDHGRVGDGLILGDASISAHILYQRFESNLLEAFHLSDHGKDLVRLGFGDDLVYCAQTDISTLVPIFKDGVIRVPSPPPSPLGGEGKGEG